MNGRLHFALVCMLCAVLMGSLSHPAGAQAKPEGEMRWALYVTVAPAWYDPGESVVGVITPFWVLYALHDALVKPMPGQPLRRQPREVVDREPGQDRLRIQAARGP